MPTLVVAERYAGPPGSANGGYLSGCLAQLLDGDGDDPVEVTLRRPPPLREPLTVVPGAEGLRLEDHTGSSPRLLAEARRSQLDVRPVDPLPYVAALAAEAGYRGAAVHPFPGCFVCGTARGDGLGLRPGPLTDRSTVTACTWTPDASVAPAGGAVAAEFVWAALDCPGGWTLDLPGRPMVLGRLTVRLDARPEVGERCVVMGELLGQHGRKASTATTVYGASGRMLGQAQATWLAVDPAAMGRR